MTVTFSDFQLSDELMTAIEKMGITNPTLIQEKAIPLIMDGYDIIGESATGSGKTLAFGAGVVEFSRHGKGVQSLILTPTRELCEQVAKSIKKMAIETDLEIATVYGGVSIDRQISALETADIVVATPGRLRDHIGRETIDLSEIYMLILDEADSMLDMGFIEDVEFIIKKCPSDERQTLFFSATMPTVIKDMAKKYMYEPVTVSAEPMVDPTKLKQVFYDVRPNQKLQLLIHLIKNEDAKLIMIFCNTRRTTDFVVKNLKANGIDALGIHGGFTQNKRSKAMDNFKDGKSSAEILVCTDVAARGLHIDNVTHVYNYDAPDDTRDYVHRAGRTARAGESGLVINIISEKDYDNFSRVKQRNHEYQIDLLPTPKLPRIKTARMEPRFQRGSRGPTRYDGRRNSQTGSYRGSRNNQSRLGNTHSRNRRFTNTN